METGENKKLYFQYIIYIIRAIFGYKQIYFQCLYDIFSLQISFKIYDKIVAKTNHNFALFSPQNISLIFQQIVGVYVI